MISVALALVLAVAAPAPVTPAQQHIALVRKAIDAGNVAYIATWQRGDAKAFAALYTFDAASLNDDGTATRGARVGNDGIETQIPVEAMHSRLRRNRHCRRGPVERKSAIGERWSDLAKSVVLRRVHRRIADRR